MQARALRLYAPTVRNRETDERGSRHDSLGDHGTYRAERQKTAAAFTPYTICITNFFVGGYERINATVACSVCSFCCSTWQGLDGKLTASANVVHRISNAWSANGEISHSGRRGTTLVLKRWMALTPPSLINGRGAYSAGENARKNHDIFVEASIPRLKPLIRGDLLGIQGCTESRQPGETAHTDRSHSPLRARCESNAGSVL